MSRFGKILYALLHFLTYPLARVLFRFEVSGSENVPLKGGVIIAGNHASYTDIPLMGCSIKRRVSYMAKSALFETPVIGWFYKHLGGFPIRRFHSKEKLGEGVRRLKTGELVLMYPEGKRTKDGRLGKGMPGIGMLVTETGVPVVPAYINGTFRVMPMGSWWIRPCKVTLSYGKPIEFKELISKSKPSKELYHEISERVMAEIRKLRDQVQPPEKVVPG